MSKNKIIGIAIIFLSLLFIGYILFANKLTFLESAYLSYSSDDVITIDVEGIVIEERFEMPYDILRSVSFKIGNYQRDSNSEWKLQISTLSGQDIVSKQFGFYDAIDNNYYLIDFGKNIRVEKGEIYRLSIQAINVDDGNKIGFYRGYNSNIYSQSSSLFVNGEITPGILCISINGGEQDYFWYIIYIIILSLLLFICIRGMIIYERGNEWKNDTIICSVAIGLIIFFVYLPFASLNVSGAFIDENDNIRGGMLIANGEILYRDYVVQHPPVAYYLCGFLALLGADSVEQMRILFYILIGIFWGMLYARFYRQFGKKTMIMLPVMIMLCTKIVTGNYSTMILSDVIQEMSMVLLLLEFICYCKDKKLDIKRDIIVSFSIWASFGSAFLSVYSLFFLVFGFIIVEIIVWKQKKITLAKFLSRYLALFTICVIPVVICIIYFWINQGLYECFRQMYLFNREVYINYQSIGGNLFEPFVSGISSMFSQYVSSILAIGGSSLSIYNILVVTTITSYFVCAIKKIKENKKNIIVYVLLTFMIAAGATRGIGDLHGMAFWGMIITWVVLFQIREWQILRFDSGRKNVLFIIASCILVLPYISAITVNISAEKQMVSYNDSLVLSLTEPGEEIFINAWNNDSIYLLAKERLPVNRVVYCLPWYMDWYEEWNIEDLISKQPNIVVWDPNQSCWERTNYAMRLNDYIVSNYSRINEGSIIWIKN